MTLSNAVRYSWTLLIECSSLYGSFAIWFSNQTQGFQYSARAQIRCVINEQCEELRVISLINSHYSVNHKFRSTIHHILCWEKDLVSCALFFFPYLYRKFAINLWNSVLTTICWRFLIWSSIVGIELEFHELFVVYKITCVRILCRVGYSTASDAFSSSTFSYREGNSSVVKFNGPISFYFAKLCPATKTHLLGACPTVRKSWIRHCTTVFRSRGYPR